jgi:hypothetical protein
VGKVLRLVIGLLMLPLLYSFGREAFDFVVLHGNWAQLQWFTLGAALYLVIDLILPWHIVEFTEVLEHEFTHAVTAIALGGRVKRLEVRSGKGGETEVENIVGPDLFWLAPYNVPIFTLPLLPARFLLPVSVAPVIDALIGFTLAFHYVGLLWEFRAFQTDLQKVGFTFSFSTSGILNIALLVFVLTVILENYAQFGAYCLAALAAAPDYYWRVYDMLGWLVERISSLAG